MTAPYAPKRRRSFKRPIRGPNSAQVTTAEIFIYEKPQRGDINKAWGNAPGNLKINKGVKKNDH